MSELQTLQQVELRLRTPRLELRPVSLDDVEELWPYVSDPELPRFMLWEAHRDRGETATWVQQCMDATEEGSAVAWVLRQQGAVRGVVGLGAITWTKLAWRIESAELGYWVASSFAGQGLATEASRAVLRFAFTGLRLHKVTVGCVSDNVGSRRVIEKLGFRLIGEQREQMYRHDRWWGHLCYEMLASEWAAQRRA